MWMNLSTSRHACNSQKIRVSPEKATLPAVVVCTLWCTQRVGDTVLPGILQHTLASRRARGQQGFLCRR